MSNLIAVAFDDEFKAHELRVELMKLQKEYLIQLEDAVVVTRNEQGQPKLDQMVNLTAAGAVGGSFWGLLIGALFLNPLVGMAMGAGAGALSGKLSDIGIDDNFMKELGKSLQPASSALFVLVRQSTPDKVLERLHGFGGKVLKTSLTKDKEEELQQALSGEEQE
jgi:uncharacterized membrane protein